MPRKFTADEARTIGSRLKIDWTKVDLEQFRQGLEVEMEHGKRDEETDVTHDDLLATGKIAWAHLKEIPDYYKRLKKVEYADKEREDITSDLIIQQSLDKLAKKPGDKKAAGKLASEVKRRMVLKRVRIGLDGMLAMDDDERKDYGEESGHWVTLENDQHVFIDGDGVLKPGGPGSKPAKGQKAKSKGKKSAKQQAPVKPQEPAKQTVSADDDLIRIGDSEDDGGSISDSGTKAVADHAVNLVHETSQFSGTVNTEELKASLAKAEGPDAAGEVDGAVQKLWQEGKIEVNEQDDSGNITSFSFKELPEQQEKKHEDEAEIRDYITQELPDMIAQADAGMLPIHELRANIKNTFGKDAASHAVLDPLLFQMRREGNLEIGGLSDLSRGNEQQLNDSITQRHGEQRQTFFWLEMPQKKSGRVDYMADAHGREHKPPGASDGGQFASTSVMNSPIQSLIDFHANADKMTVSEARSKTEELIRGLSKTDLSEVLKGMGFTPSGSAKAMAAKIVQQITELAATGAQSRQIDEMFRHQVDYAWDESQHPRGQPENAGEFVEKSGTLKKNTGPKANKNKGGDKQADKVKFVGAKVGATVHAHAESVKNYIAKAVGGIPEELTSDAGQKDKKPYDVKLPSKGKDHDIEVKSMTVGSKTSISVHEDALLRKVEHVNATGNAFHTVVVDDRETYDDGANKKNFSGNRLYYKRGSGRYALGKMYPVKDEAELKKLILMADDKLPEAAQGTLPPPPPVDKLKETAAKASESRKARDAARKERNKDLLREQARARAAKKREAA